MSEASDAADSDKLGEAAESGRSETVDLASLDPTDYRTRSGAFGDSALPHRYASEGITFQLTECTTDQGEEVPFEPTTDELSAVGKEWNSINITGTIKVTDWGFDYVFPTGEKGDLEADWEGRLGLVCWCRDTIWREGSETLSVDSPGTYGEFTVTIERDQVRKSVHFRPALVRGPSDEGAGGDPDDEFATFPGQRLADGELWTLRTDLEQSTSNLLHPETKNFSDDDDLPEEDHLVFVDLDRDPPGVYLNGDHERIIAALDDDSNQGWDASTREVVYDTIEAEVWPQFILEAASDINEEGGPETPWKQKVIEKFREDIYGAETTYEEAIDLLRQDVSTPERLPRLMQDIDGAVQTRNDPPSHLDSLFTLIDNR